MCGWMLRLTGRTRGCLPWETSGAACCGSCVDVLCSAASRGGWWTGRRGGVSRMNSGWRALVGNVGVRCVCVPRRWCNVVVVCCSSRLAVEFVEFVEFDVSAAGIASRFSVQGWGPRLGYPWTALELIPGTGESSRHMPSRFSPCPKSQRQHFFISLILFGFPCNRNFRTTTMCHQMSLLPASPSPSDRPLPFAYHQSSSASPGLGSSHVKPAASAFSHRMLVMIAR